MYCSTVKDENDFHIHLGREAGKMKAGRDERTIACHLLSAMTTRFV
jgi:hypothetical protein